mgnify:CR=1 FL=1
MEQAILKLDDIVKDYKVADSTVHALKGVSLAFRKKEFVSILGPSGCGKTTLLNIIGGLDQYTDGDLVIKGVSTKNYKDRDWDAYRNHSIGFVFQSYNLIPHQTVLGNVELALTLSGVSAAERKARAKQALERVGLGEQLDKKPNQLSGGQMQRVAIARALVNNPEILLADEPTGALDTETSVQIMELIKEIAGERLVIMVTHNPELAERYSTRIVRLLDGQVTDDTDPLIPEEGEEGALFEEAPAAAPAAPRGRKEKKQKTSMSFWTAFLLSGRNLLTKKARTLVTAIAGSIGIISVCLVLALSNGFSAYIRQTEEDMLSYYPVQVTETSMDLTAAMSSFMSGSTSNLELDKIEDKVYVNSFLSQLAQGMTTSNDLSGGNAYTDENGNTVTYLDYVNAMPEDLYYAIHYGYGVSLTNNLFTSVGVGSDVTSHLGIPQERVHLSMSMLREYYEQILMTAADEYSSLVQFVDYFTDVVNAMPGTDDLTSESYGEYVLSQYDIVAGDFPTSTNQVVFIVGEQNDATDLTLAQLGFIDEDDFLDLFLNSQDGESETMSIPFEDVVDENGAVTQEGIIGTKFQLYYNDAVFTGSDGDYTYNGYERNWEGETTDENGVMTDADGNEIGVELEIVGVLRLKDGLTYGCMEEGLGLTEQLIQEYIAKNMQSGIVQYLQGQSGSDSSTTMNLGEYVPLLTYYTLRNSLDTYLSDTTGSVTLPSWVTDEQKAMLDALKSWLESQGTELTEEQLDQLMETVLSMLPANISSYAYAGVTQSGIDTTIRALGGNDAPSSVSVYARDFDSKDEMLGYLDGWNSIVEQQRLAYFEENGTYDGYDGPTEVTYTDTVGTLMGLMNTILNAITYVLVAFTGISLVVSTVMIGVITYVSVVERTKEIGVLRSIGARKKDIRHVFNAESFIVGLCSGIIGVAVAYLLELVVNAVLLPLTGIAGLAALPVTSAVIMLVISVVLTLISGLIPASAAAKRDPVVALRTE